MNALSATALLASLYLRKASVTDTDFWRAAIANH
jgi:hypothetical protein